MSIYMYIYIQYSCLTSKLTDSISTCFAEARAVFAEAILQKITKKWYRGSSRKQFNFIEEAFAEAAAVIAEALRKPLRT